MQVMSVYLQLCCRGDWNQHGHQCAQVFLPEIGPCFAEELLLMLFV
jgi:hypothetical protein